MPAITRIAHFSDIHVTTDVSWRWTDWLSKRATGRFNWTLLGRGQRFQDAERICAALKDDIARRGCDGAIFSGDATAFGFAEEQIAAANALGVSDSLVPAIAVPGNHDYYTRSAARSGAFEAAFAPWLLGERVDSETYPFARRIGQVWFVAVNSAVPNRLAWDARGQVSADELRRLEILLKRLGPEPIVIVSHYPLTLADYSMEPRWHRLRNVLEIERVTYTGGVSLWLNGHRHRPYFVAGHPREEPVFPQICAGSATQRGVAGYGEYSIDDKRVHALRRVYDPETGTFCDGETFEVALPGS